MYQNLPASVMLPSFVDEITTEVPAARGANPRFPRLFL
jgi:hypothetical protein